MWNLHCPCTTLWMLRVMLMQLFLYSLGWSTTKFMVSMLLTRTNCYMCTMLDYTSFVLLFLSICWSWISHHLFVQFVVILEVNNISFLLKIWATYTYTIFTAPVMYMVFSVILLQFRKHHHKFSNLFQCYPTVWLIVRPDVKWWSVSSGCST